MYVLYSLLYIHRWVAGSVISMFWISGVQPVLSLGGRKLGFVEVEMDGEGRGEIFVDS